MFNLIEELVWETPNRKMLCFHSLTNALYLLLQNKVEFFLYIDFLINILLYEKNVIYDYANVIIISTISPSLSGADLHIILLQTISFGPNPSALCDNCLITV